MGSSRITGQPGPKVGRNRNLKEAFQGNRSWMAGIRPRGCTVGCHLPKSARADGPNGRILLNRIGTNFGVYFNEFPSVSRTREPESREKIVKLRKTPPRRQIRHTGPHPTVTGYTKVLHASLEKRGY